MTQWRLQSTPDVALQDGDLTPWFAPLQGDGESTTEADVQLKMYTAYTLSDIRVNATVVGDNGTYGLRDDGVSSSNVIAVISGTGWVEDVTGSDTITADSLMNGELLELGGMHGDDLTINAAMITYEHASIDAPIMGGKEQTSTPADNFYAIKSRTRNTTEAEQERLIKRSSTASNFRVYSSSSLSSDWYVRQNQSSSSNLTISFSAESGSKEDVTGSDSFAAGDDFAFMFDYGSGSGSTELIVQVDFDTAEDVWGAPGFSHDSGATRYLRFMGDGNVSGTQDVNYDARIGSTTAANMQGYMSVHDGAVSWLCSLFVGGVTSTNVALAFTGTGLLEDVTGSESIDDTDSVETENQLTGAVGTSTITRVEVELPWSEVSLPITGSFPAWQRRTPNQVMIKTM